MINHYNEKSFRCDDIILEYLTYSLEKLNECLKLLKNRIRHWGINRCDLTTHYLCSANYLETGEMRPKSCQGNHWVKERSNVTILLRDLGRGKESPEGTWAENRDHKGFWQELKSEVRKGKTHLTAYRECKPFRLPPSSWRRRISKFQVKSFYTLHSSLFALLSSFPTPELIVLVLGTVNQ